MWTRGTRGTRGICGHVGYVGYAVAMWSVERILCSCVWSCGRFR